jgi:O-antigen ligase
MRITETYFNTGVFILTFMVMAWAPFFGGPRLFSFLLALVGIGLLWKQRDTIWQQPAVRRLASIFLLLGIPMLISLPGSYDVKGTLVVTCLLVLFFPMGVTLVRVFRNTQLRERLTLWIAILVCFWAVDGLIQFIFGKDLLGIPTQHGKRVVGIFRDNVHIGVYLATLMPLLALTLMKRSRLLAAAMIILAATVVVLTGTRTTWVVLSVAGIMMLFTYPFRHRTMAIGTSAGIICIAVAVTFSPIVQMKIDQTTAGLDWSYTSIDKLLSHRLKIWDTATRMANARPLNGVGVQAFREAYEQFEREPGTFRKQTGFPVNHAHQAYFSVWAESGYPGLLGLLVIWGLLLRWYFNNPREQRRQALPYAIGLVAAMFPLNSQPVLYSGWWFPVLLLLTALMLAALDDKPGAEGIKNEL